MLSLASCCFKHVVTVVCVVISLLLCVKTVLAVVCDDFVGFCCFFKTVLTVV